MKSSNIKYVISFILISSLQSCNFALFTPNYRKEWQKAKFQDIQDNGVEKYINTRGYYASPRERSEPIYFFYKNGTCSRAYFRFPDMRMKPDMEIKQEHLEGLWKDGDWGWNAPYVIEGDSIIVDEYCLYLMAWELVRKTFKILDCNTLVITDAICYERDSMESNRYIYNDTLHFVPANSIPTCNIGMKKKKFTWKSAGEYEAFKREMKESRRANKLMNK